MASDEGFVDPAVLARLRDLGGEDEPGFLAGLIREFLAHADREVDEMRAAVGAGDARRLADLGHSLKGSAANLGARALSARGQAIERAAKAGEAAAAKDLVEEAAAELSRVRPRLEAEAEDGA